MGLFTAGSRTSLDVTRIYSRYFVVNELSDHLELAWARTAVASSITLSSFETLLFEGYYRTTLARNYAGSESEVLSETGEPKLGVPSLFQLILLYKVSVDVICKPD